MKMVFPTTNAYRTQRDAYVGRKIYFDPEEYTVVKYVPAKRVKCKDCRLSADDKPDSCDGPDHCDGCYQQMETKEDKP